MKTPRPLSLVKLNPEYISHIKGELKDLGSGKIYLYLGEISNTTGHCVVLPVARPKGISRPVVLEYRPLIGYRSDTFIELAEDGT